MTAEPVNGSLRDLRHKRLVEVFRPWVDEWADVVTMRHAFDDLRYVMRYISKLKDAEEIKEFDQFLEHELGSDAKGIMISLYDQLIQEGMERGEVAGERKLLMKLLHERFGSLDAETERRVATATIEQLETWGTRVLFATTVAEVLAD